MAVLCRIISRCWLQQHLKIYSIRQNKTKWVRLPQICAKVQKSLKQPPKDSEHGQVLNDFFPRIFLNTVLRTSSTPRCSSQARFQQHPKILLQPDSTTVISFRNSAIFATKAQHFPCYSPPFPAPLPSPVDPSPVKPVSPVKSPHPPRGWPWMP